MKNFLKRFLAEEDGQGMVEYAVIVFLIAIAVFTIVRTFGTQIGATFTNITNRLR